jgi:hypothetical protein
MPIQFIDLDGLEPASPKEDLVETSSSNYPYQNGTISNVIDPAKNDTEMSLFMPANSDKSFSWKTWDDKDAVFSEASHQNGEWNGRWVQYEPVPSYERQSQLAAYDFCDKAPIGLVATLAAPFIAAPLAGEGSVFAAGNMGWQSIALRGSTDATAQVLSNVANNKPFYDIDVYDTSLAAVTALGYSALFGGLVDIKLSGNVSVICFNKTVSRSVMEVGIKYTFGGAGLGKYLSDGLSAVNSALTPRIIGQVVKSEVPLMLHLGIAFPLNLAGKQASTEGKKYFK